MQDDVDELHYNPFAAPVNSRPKSLSTSSLQNNSLFPTSLSTLSDTANTHNDDRGSYAGRDNHHTEIRKVQAEDTSILDHHPLRSAGLSHSFEDAGVTRPHLTRILDSDRLVDVPSFPNDEEDTGQNKATSNEKVVIVHEVSSNDSLAGVALKYRINLTELRRANHLWSSDTIHLRNVLYIPLEKTSLPPPTVTPSFASSLDEPTSFYSHKSTFSEDSQSPTATTISSSAIRRIPASELSFFPPPSRTSALSNSSSPSPPSQPRLSNSRTIHIRHATTPAPSLNTILTALPIAASTRDTIIARLSFDSPSSSYNDQEREPYLNGYEGHELADVQAGREPSRRSLEEDRQGYLDGVTTKLLKNSQSTFTNDSVSKQPDISAINPDRKARSERLGPKFNGHGRSFSEEFTGLAPSLPSISSTRIRNVQLEPSPVMQIPIKNNENSSQLCSMLCSTGTKKVVLALIELDPKVERT
ncbi:peptidoglycan-binding LysM domain protein [Lentinula lateritia]|nr:peptidoglycan-binding LysM domain protein [Lentinula lateritia]